MTVAPGWRATLDLRFRSSAEADRLLAALGPEVAREVPRARSALARPGPHHVELSVAARDTGALRAALNTYLGWAALAAATEAIADPPAPAETAADRLGAKRF